MQEKIDDLELGYERQAFKEAEEFIQKERIILICDKFPVFVQFILRWVWIVVVVIVWYEGISQRAARHIVFSTSIAFTGYLSFYYFLAYFAFGLRLKRIRFTLDERKKHLQKWRKRLLGNAEST